MSLTRIYSNVHFLTGQFNVVWVAYVWCRGYNIWGFS